MNFTGLPSLDPLGLPMWSPKSNWPWAWLWIHVPTV